MFSKIKKKLKKRYEPKEKGGEVLFRFNKLLGAYIFTFIIFILMGLFFLLLSVVDCAFGVMGIIWLIFGMLLIGFLRLCEPAYILDQDHLEIHVFGIHWKIYYRDIKFVYKSATSIVIERREKHPYMIDARYVDPSFEKYLDRYLRYCNQKVRKTVPSTSELRSLNLDIKTDFYIKQAGALVISIFFIIWGLLCTWLLLAIDFHEDGLFGLFFALALMVSNIALCLFMICRYLIRYHFADSCIEQKLFFFTIKRVDLIDISKVTKKEEYVRVNRGNSYYTDMIRIYGKGKELFKNRPINSAEFYNFSDVLIYFGNKKIKIQELS